MTASTHHTAPYLRTVAGVRFAIGIFLTGLGALMLSRGIYGPAALLLAVAAVHFTWGSWQLLIARSRGAVHSNPGAGALVR